jgi:prolyl oligopeptidase
MFCRVRALVVAALLVLGALPAYAGNAALLYPETRAVPVTEVRFGETVADPYRWLENDVRSDPEVADWVARQDEVTRRYLAGLPQREWFAQRIRSLMDYERFSLPRKAGRSYFYTRNSGLLNQPQLFVRRGLGGKPRLLLDPNNWSGDGTVALDDWEPSPEGRMLAYTVQEGGSDWRTIRVLDVKSGQVMADRLEWAKFTRIAWIGEEGFLYSRFPAPRPGMEHQAVALDQAVYFHRLGTPQVADELVYSTPDKPSYSHSAEVTHDRHWVVITTAEGTDSKYEVRLAELRRSRQASAIELGGTQGLVLGLEHDWRLVEGLGNTLYFITNQNASKLKVVSVDVTNMTQRAWDQTCGPEVVDGEGIADCPLGLPVFREVIPERPDRVLDRAQIVGDRLILSYLKDAASTAEVVSLDGKPVQQITLNAIGTATGFTGRPDDPETFFAFSSFNRPSGVYRFDSRTGKAEPFALPRLTFEPADYAIEQRFFTSKDGTRVPMFLVRKKGIAVEGRAVPTILYGYGGFEVSLTPNFSAVRMAWLEAGGAFAMANLRGGSEYGKEWHEAGRLHNKQNVFDDFIAAGEYLIAQGITPRGGLAIQGGSNGGLLVGAVLNQRPEMFAAANPAVGVMDMLRFDRFTAGRYWTDDYGDPAVEADFKVLRAYSPYHNIRAGTDYPAVLVTTADTDDRVVPAHSFKYAAALQAARAGRKPHLIRIERGAGHGAGKPTAKLVNENADVLAFLARWTGLQIP